MAAAPALVPSEMKPYPWDPFHTPMTAKKHQAAMETAAGLSAYYLFIPLTSLQPGALALNQWNNGVGQKDGLLYESFCAAVMRRAGRMRKGKVVSRLMVTIMPDDQGIPVGHLYTLYDNDLAMKELADKIEERQREAKEGGVCDDDEADDGGSGSAQKQKVNMELKVAKYSFAEYLNQLPGSNPAPYYAHLKRLIQTAGFGDWMSHWPSLLGVKGGQGGISGDRPRMQSALYTYLSMEPDGDEKYTAPDFSNPDHPFHATKVFTLENALNRYRMARPYIYDPVYEDPVTGVKGRKFATVAEFLEAYPGTETLDPFWPCHTYAISDSFLVPLTMRNYCMPVVFDLEALKEEFTTSAYRQFKQENYLCGGPEVKEETIQRMYLAQSAFQTTPAYTTMAEFFAHYDRLSTNQAVSKERRFQSAVRDLNALLRPSLQEGDAVRALIQWNTEFLRDNDGHYALHMSPVREYVDLEMGAMAHFVAVTTQWLSLVCRVADQQRTILALGLVMHASVVPPKSDEELQLQVALTGTAGTGKSYSLNTAVAMFAVKGTAEAINHASALADSGSENNRFYIEVKDELQTSDLDVPEDAVTTFKCMQAILNKSAMSVNEKAANFKRQRTTTKQMTSHMFIGPDGKRIKIKTATVNHGHKFGGTNIPQALMMSAMADRTICKECPVMDATGALDQIVADMQQKLNTHIRDSKSSIRTYLNRTHYLYFRYNLLVHAKLLPGIDDSNFAQRIRVLVDELTRMGVTDAGAPRRIFKLKPVASVLAFQEALTLCFDWGIGGPDLGRPYHDKDLKKLLPLLVIRDETTFFSAELLPVFLPEIQLACLQGIRRLFYERKPGEPVDTLRDTVRPDTHDGYRRLAGFFRGTDMRRQGFGDSYKTTLCAHLARVLRHVLKVPFDERAVFCTCATLLTDIVATQPDGKQMVYVPGWRVDTGGSEEEACDLVIHSKLLNPSCELNDDFMFTAICKTLNDQEPQRTVLRGTQHPKQRDMFALGKLRPTAVANEEIALAQYEADLEEWEANEAEIQKQEEAKRAEMVASGLQTAAQIEQYLCDLFGGKRYPKPQKPKQELKPWQYPDRNYMDKATRKRLRESYIGALDARAFDEDSESQPTATISATMDEDLAERRLKLLDISDEKKTHYARPANLVRCMEAHAKAAWSITKVKGNPTVDHVHGLLLKYCRMWVVYEQHQALCEPPSQLHCVRTLQKAGLSDPRWGQALYQAYQEWVQPYRSDLALLEQRLQAWVQNPVSMDANEEWERRFAVLASITAGVAADMDVDRMIDDLPPPVEAMPRNTSDNLAQSSSSSSDEEAEPILRKVRRQFKSLEVVEEDSVDRMDVDV